MSKIKVILILFGDSLEGGGGAERRFMKAFSTLSKKQKIALFINEKLLNSAARLNLINKSIRVICFKECNFFRRLKFNIDVIKCIIRSKPTIVHLPLIQKSLIPIYIFFFLFKRLLKITTVCTVASYPHAYRIGLKCFDRLVYFIFLKCADRIDSLYYNIKIDRHASVTPCSFIDYERFTALEKENTVVFLGRLIPEKNPILFLEAINIILNEQENSKARLWKFVISGEGRLKARILDFISNHHLNEYVKLIKGEPCFLLGKSKIFVSLQEHENYPSQSLLEAISCENIIIATDVGDTKRLLKGGGSTILIAPQKEILAKAIEKAIKNEKIFLSKTKFLKEAVQKEHNLENFAQYLISLWNSETL